MATTRLTTVEDLEQIQDENRYDLIQGELICMPPATPGHGEISMMIGARLWMHVWQNRLGKVYASETAFTLARNPDTVLAPDVAYVRSDRAIPEHERWHFAKVAPDLVVEVRSPSETAPAILRKVAAYLEAGVSAVWVADPKTRTLTVYLPEAPVAVLHEGDTLDGSSIVPGFRLPVAEIFES